ncbi:MAG: sigma 54-interacting transcriptional regulator [Pseudomonadota bacterium]
MGATCDTTVRDDESVAGAARPRLWLRWVFPTYGSAVALEHGLDIGRDAGCALCLRGKGVSRRHVEIHRQGPVFALKDLGSTNGTFLNGQRTQHAAIAPGSVLRLGEHVGIFSESVVEPSDFRELARGLFGGHELDVALAALRRAALSNLSVVILGATGTGKERVARAIHDWSGRKGPFHALNCAALPKDLAEAELFGYRKGAFTGAERASLGHFRAADRGTLFLDEIVDLPLVLQAKLLRVLEEAAVMSLGDTEAVPIDVRVIAAAQRPLSAAVRSGHFREDLLARLAGMSVSLPTLRERRADVAPLFQHFINHYSGGRPPEIEAKLIEALCVYDWPSNVRELEQLSRQLLAVHGLEPMLKRSSLPAQQQARLPATSESIPPPSNGELSERGDYDLQRLAAALAQTNGNVASAAALLGFSRQRAYRLLDGRTAATLLAEGAAEHGAVAAREDT